MALGSGEEGAREFQETPQPLMVALKAQWHHQGILEYLLLGEPPTPQAHLLLISQRKNRTPERQSDFSQITQLIGRWSRSRNQISWLHTQTLSTVPAGTLQPCSLCAFDQSWEWSQLYKIFALSLTWTHWFKARLGCKSFPKQCVTAQKETHTAYYSIHLNEEEQLWKSWLEFFFPMIEWKEAGLGVRRSI